MSSLPASKKQLASSWQAQTGPLEAFLADPSVTEIMVNGPHRIFVEQKGLLKRTQAKFESEAALLALMVKISATVGKSLDAANPCVDGRLPDGSRVNCVIAPVAIDGPALTIRKFSATALTVEQLMQHGTFDERIAYFLNCCVLAKMNVLVSGGTGSGKTTLLNILASFIPLHERIVTIEDAAELKLRNENLVRMESRPSTPTEAGISTRSLVVNALRMRPDRIIVGECRGPEAFDMLTAMNTGHEGSMTTIHANTARDALRRLETMVLIAGAEMPLKVIRENISRALNLIVQIQRQPDGARRVTEIIEVSGMEADTILTQDIFRHSPEQGFQSQGFVPQFIRHFKSRGVDFPADFFANDRYRVSHKKSKA